MIRNKLIHLAAIATLSGFTLAADKPAKQQPQPQPAPNRNATDRTTPAQRDGQPRREDPPARDSRKTEPQREDPPRNNPPRDNRRDNVHDPNRDGRLDRDPAARNRRNDSNREPTVVYVPQWYGVPSYWWDRNHWGYSGRTYRDDDEGFGRNDYPVTPRPTPTPTINEPSPTQEQARSINALEANEEYRRLSIAAKQAQTEYEAASRKVIERLKEEDEEYQRLLQQRADLEDKVEAVQASAKIPNPEQVTPAAEQKLKVSTRVTQMEQDAIANDTTASAAKQKVVELNDRLTAMRRQAQAGGAR